MAIGMATVAGRGGGGGKFDGRRGGGGKDAGRGGGGGKETRDDVSS